MLVVSLPTIVMTHQLVATTTDNSGSSTGGGTTTDNSGSSTGGSTDNSGSSTGGWILLLLITVAHQLVGDYHYY